MKETNLALVYATLEYELLSTQNIKFDIYNSKHQKNCLRKEKGEKILKPEKQKKKTVWKKMEQFYSQKSILWPIIY